MSDQHLENQPLSPAEDNLFPRQHPDATCWTKEWMRSETMLDIYLRAPHLSDKELYSFVLEKTVALTDSRIGFFHLISDDQKYIILTAWNSEALKRCMAIHDNHYPLAKAGNWVDCVRFKRPVVYNDFHNSPNQKGLPGGHTPVERFMSIPVVEDGKVRFIFGVGNKPEDYNSQDVAHLQLVANELFKVISRRRIEEALRASKEKYRGMVDNIQMGVALISPDMKILETNSRMQEWFPGAATAHSLHCYEIFNVPPRQAPCEKCAVRETLQDGRVHEEIIEKNGNGAPRKYRAIASPIRDAEGKIVAAIEMVEDITSQLALENQLRQAQKMEAIGQLAGGVAHDFNNILQAIQGYSQLLMHMLPAETEQHEFITEIIRASERAAALTRQLLAFSRQQIMEPKVLDLNFIIENLLKMIGRTLGEHVELQFKAGKDMGPIYADPGQMEQIVMNLCVNARDAMPDGGMLLIETKEVELDAAYCEFHAETTPGTYIRLSVTDSGCGMDKETMKRIFDPFYTTKEQGKGTGLGLATVYGIVKQHKANIQIYSEIDTGTTFTIYFPRVEGQDDQRTQTAVSIPAGGSETILLAEDDETIGRLTSRILESAGYTVLLANNGEEAMELGKKHLLRLDMALLDVVMPKKNGKEVYAALKQMRPDLPVLFCSGYSENAIHTNFVLDSGISLIQKPFSTAKLLEKVRQVLDSTET